MRAIHIRILIGVFIVACVGFLLSSQAVEALGQSLTGWTEPITLGDGWFPNIATDATGRVHIAWAGTILSKVDQQGDPSKAYDVVWYTNSIDGVNWSPVEDLVALVQFPVGNSEVTRPNMFIDPEGTFHITFRSFDVFYAQARYANHIMASELENVYRANINDWGYFSQSLKDADGIMHLVFTENVQTEQCPVCYQVFYRRSTDNGNSWSIRNAISLATTGAAKPQMLISDTGSIHVVFESGVGGTLGKVSNVDSTVMHTASYDGGLTWEPAEEFMPLYRDIKKNIAIGQDRKGQLIVVWLRSSTNRLYYQVSRDDGRTWTEAVPIYGVGGRWKVVNTGQDGYSMANDSLDIVHLVFVGTHEQNQEGLNVLHMTWNGDSWSEPDDVVEYAGDVPEWPRIAVGLGNQLHVVWFTRDAKHVWTSDDGEAIYQIHYARGMADAPEIAPKAYAYQAPTKQPSPTPTAQATATATAMIASLTQEPLDPNAPVYIRSENDELISIGLSLAVPVILIIVMVMIVLRVRNG